MKSELPIGDLNPQPCAPLFLEASNSSGFVFSGISAPWYNGWMVECIPRDLAVAFLETWGEPDQHPVQNWFFTSSNEISQKTHLPSQRLYIDWLSVVPNFSAERLSWLFPVKCQVNPMPTWEDNVKVETLKYRTSKNRLTLSILPIGFNF